jgi:hypothetical protein
MAPRRGFMQEILLCDRRFTSRTVARPFHALGPDGPVRGGAACVGREPRGML